MNQQLDCPNCGSPIPAEDVSLDNFMARCRSCDHIFSFEQTAKLPIHKQTEILLPPGIEAFATHFELDIEVKWRQSSKTLGFFLFFALFWNGVVSVFVVAALLSGEFIMLAGISVHLLIGIGLIYYLLCMFLNTTYIMVSHREINIEHRPIPMPFYPDLRLRASEIEQIYTEQYVASRTNGNPNYAFSVIALLKDSKTIKLVKGLKYPDQALYIEQEVEKFLAIPDRPVAEEWKALG